MATSQQPNRTDDYARAGKRLASQRQRIQDQTGADPGRHGELVDALNALTGHRIAGHAWAQAGADAQDAVRRASALLFGAGAIGPYTEGSDARRCAVALIQLAAVQAELGLDEAAAATLGTWAALREQLSQYRVDVDLPPAVASRALLAAGRAELALNVAQAGAYADAAVARAGEAPSDGDDYLALDADRLASDVRRAAGRPAESLAFAHSAVRRHDTLADGVLEQPGRYPPGLVARLAEPLFGVRRDYADRAVAAGDTDLALDIRRGLVAILRGLRGRLPGAAGQLAAALGDQAHDLSAAGRADEALDSAEEAVAVAAEREAGARARLLAAGARVQTLLAAGRQDEAEAVLAAALTAAPEAEPSIGAARDWLLRLRDDPTDADARDRARGVPPAGRTRIEWAPLDAAAAHGPASPPDPAVDTTALAAERERARVAEAERAEAAQLAAHRQRSERAAAERAEAARLAGQRQRAAQAERAAQERRAAAEEEERLQRKRKRAERLREHAVEVAARAATERAERRTELTERLAGLTAGSGGLTDAEVERVRRELAELDRAERTAQAELAEALRTATAEADPRSEPDAATAASADTEEAAAEDKPVEAEDKAVEAEEKAVQAEDKPVEAEEKPVAAEATVVHAQPEADSTPAERRADPEAPAEPTPSADPVAPEPADPAAPEPAAPDDLELAERAYAEARARGERRASRQALERVVELLRPRVSAGRADASRLRAALEDLSGARLRGGDLFGSRAAAREAKALAREMT